MSTTIREDFTLPSLGKIYDKPVDPNIILNSMTTRDEMLRKAPTNTPYKVLSDIIESCMQEKPAIHVYDMCFGDYVYLLHKIRIVTYGTDYTMTTYCPVCGNLEETTIDLEDIAVNEYKEGVLDLLEVELPVTHKKVKLLFETPRMIDKINNKVEEYKKKMPNLDTTMLATLQEAIDTVDGNKLSYIDKENFIMKLPARDAKKLMKSLEDFNREVGIDSRFIYTCSRCNNEVLNFFRFSDKFFGSETD